jgi:hypothetical protein
LNERAPSNILFNLTYLAVTTLAFARLAPAKTQVNRALCLGIEMNWLFFIVGFISCCSLVILFLILVNHVNKIEPVMINEGNNLHDIIAGLYRKGKNGDTLFILDRTSGFSIRIIKIERKAKEDTLKVEIRATDQNAERYLFAKEALSNEGFEFEEELTPKRKRPSRICLKNDQGGIYIIPSIVKTVSKVMISINSKKELDVLAGYKDPFFWKKTKT